MDQKILSVFDKAKYKTTNNLPEDIWQNIVKREKRITLLKFYTFAFIGIGSFVGIIPTSKILIQNFSQSGFYEYLSVAFSPNGFATYYWKEFALLLAESLPVMSIILSSALIFIFFLSLRYTIKQIIKGQLTFAKLSF